MEGCCIKQLLQVLIRTPQSRKVWRRAALVRASGGGAALLAALNQRLIRITPLHHAQVCVQLGDSVPFRFHWPRAADLRVNAMAYRPYGRNPSSKLGHNARDEPANVGACRRAGLALARSLSPESSSAISIVTGTTPPQRA